MLKTARNPFGSLRGRLVLVTVALLATALLAAVGLLVDAAQRHRASAEAQLTETSRALSLAVDERVLQGEVRLQTLSASPALESGNLQDFETQARGSMAGDGAWIVVIDRQGKALLDTRLPPGKALTKRPQDTGYNARFAATLKAGYRISGMTHSRASGALIVQIDHVVAVRGEPTYLVALVLPQITFQGLLGRQGLPGNWYSGIVDHDGIVIARSHDTDHWVGKPATTTSIARFQASSTGVFENAARDGVLTLTGFTRSQVTGWTTAVAIPRYAANGDLGRSLQWLSIAGAALLVMGGGLSLWFIGSLARAIRSLETFAEGMGRGNIEAPAPTGLSETDFIAQAMSTAGARLHAREEELERINQTLEARVEEATARLAQSQKAEAIGRLTRGVAHDFNNLLTAVIGNLDLLRRKVSDERLKQFVENARTAADRGAKLTAQLLAFARKQQLSSEPVDVNALIGAMRELLGSTLGSSDRIVTEFDQALPPAMADPSQMEMILLNLLLNSRDAMPDGGLVTIGTRIERIDEPPARAEQPPMGVFVRITVADSGTGMPPEVIERAFEPFFTTKPHGGGSGLGLSQALGAVQQLGGGLRINSASGQGTRVHVYLPVATAEPLGSAEEASGRRYALIMDPDGEARADAAHWLGELGWGIVEAEGPQAALWCARSQGFDLALIEYEAAGPDWTELLHALRGTNRKVRVVATSVAPPPEPLKGAAALSKPYVEDDIVRIGTAVDTGKPALVAMNL